MCVTPPRPHAQSHKVVLATDLQAKSGSDVCFKDFAHYSKCVACLVNVMFFLFYSYSGRSSTAC